MTQDKAREYFSAYHEGALEPGLASSLERKLQSDADLRLEYEAFAATIVALDALRSEAIEIPLYLSDRIATRLENVRDVSVQPFWATWFRPRASAYGPNRFVWVTGLAACLLLASIGLRGMQTTNTIDATVGNGSAPESLHLTQTSAGFVLTVPGGTSRTLSVAPQGGDVKDFNLAARQGLELTLSNPNRLARRFTVSAGSEVLATVVLPGDHTVARKAGSGTVTEFASALADAYRVPVVVKSGATTSTLRWTFENGDAYTAAGQGLNGGQGSVTKMDNDVLQIGR